MRTRPYRSDHIISVIRKLIFDGGDSSFAVRFDQIFRQDGTPPTRETPAPLVSLVSTVVRHKRNMFVNQH
jgi:hypothetical protein